MLGKLVVVKHIGDNKGTGLRSDRHLDHLPKAAVGGRFL